MKKDPDHNSTDSAEIKALITRIERGQLRDEDAQLLTRLLRLLLRLITLLQQKNGVPSVSGRGTGRDPQEAHGLSQGSLPKGHIGFKTVTSPPLNYEVGKL